VLPLSQSWTLLRSAVNGFLDDEALTRGAAIAFYTATSFAPVLLIVIAIADLVYGQEAAQGAITAQLGDLMGRQTAELLQTAVASSKAKSSGLLAAAIGIITLVITASGVFGEMQAALNKIWKAEAKGMTVGHVVQARAKSLGLVAALGFLLMVSLAVSAALTAFADRINAALPFGGIILSALNVLVSLALISFLFAAVFKVLPDCDLQWRDVAIGAVITAVLFIGGKSLIGLYIGSSAVASTYGAAGGLIVLLLWSTIRARFSCSALRWPDLMHAFMEANGRPQSSGKRFGLRPRDGFLRRRPRVRRTHG
jgi:membrane protein